MSVKFCLAVIFSFSFVICKAQINDSTEVKANYGSSISDVQILMELDHIDFYKVHFKNRTNKNKWFFLISKTYLNGKLTLCDTILPLSAAKDIFKLTHSDTSLVLSLITKPTNDSVAFYFRYKSALIPRNYKRLTSNNYSLRDGLVTSEKYKKIPDERELPLFVYSLPYEDPKNPGYLYYCALTANGVPPEKWWEKYGIKHYIIVEIKIVNP